MSSCSSLPVEHLFNFQDPFQKIVINLSRSFMQSYLLYVYVFHRHLHYSCSHVSTLHNILHCSSPLAFPLWCLPEGQSLSNDLLCKFPRHPDLTKYHGYNSYSKLDVGQIPIFSFLRDLGSVVGFWETFLCSQHLKLRVSVSALYSKAIMLITS